MTDKIRDALAQLATDRAAFNAIDLYHSRSWAAARAALAEPPAPSVPSVPREPTPEMFDAALPNGNAWTAGTIWRAMYDAAINDQSGGGAVAPEQANAEKAEAECERLRADAERLDWLDVNWHGAIFGKNERGYLPWADGVDYQPTLRAAIDAARGKP